MVIKTHTHTHTNQESPHVKQVNKSSGAFQQQFVQLNSHVKTKAAYSGQIHVYELQSETIS